MDADGRRARLARYLPVVMLVTDASRLRGRTMAGVVRAAVDGGVNIVQLRETALSHDERLALASEVRDAAAGRALLLVNDDADAAITAGTDGLHLRSDDTTTRRGDIPQHILISRAVHGVEAAVAAERDGADMLVLGTIFASGSHPGGATIGLAGVRAVCDAVRVPVVAIGGITAANAGGVMRAGASGIAVIGAIFDAEDARAAAAELCAAVETGARP
jgi:thiamine-phosphate pyrophosphorylase